MFFRRVLLNLQIHQFWDPMIIRHLKYFQGRCDPWTFPNIYTAIRSPCLFFMRGWIGILHGFLRRFPLILPLALSGQLDFKSHGNIGKAANRKPARRLGENVKVPWVELNLARSKNIWATRKKKALLSIKSWLLNRSPCNGLCYSPFNCVV